MNTLREQLITEIQHIPDKHLQALFNLIHAFRTDLNNEQVDKPVNIRQFAGAWADMDEAVFTDWDTEWKERRRQAFS